jgi:tetratricopeptide (TPR) repeat protein
MGTPLAVTFADDTTLRRAMAALQAKSFKDAEHLFKEVLCAQPKHLAALNLLGAVLMQTGRYAEAEPYLQAALKEQPKSDATLYNYGLVLKALGRPAEALDKFSQALTLNPSAFETWNNRGTVFSNLERYNEAIGDFDRALALRPDYAQALCNKGKSLAALRRLDEALAAFARASALKPDLAEAWLGRAQVSFQRRNFEEALVGFTRVLALRDDSAHALLGRGNSLYMLKRYDEALTELGRASALDAASADIWLAHGNIFCELGRHDEAIEACEKALSLKPDLADGWLCRGNILSEQERQSDALSAYDHALRLDPELASAWLGRGKALFSLNRHPEALVALDRASAIDAEFAEPHYNKSLVALALGDYTTGWALYEWRWKVRSFTSLQRRFAQPLWRGAPIAGRTILLHTEQGFGDAIQFFRYVPLLQNQGCKIVAEVPRSLLPLFHVGHENIGFVGRGDALPDFEIHCPFMSLPLAFGTTLHSIPSQCPYLFVSDEKRNQWRARLGGGTGPRVGLSWSGNSRPDPNRSIPADELDIILDSEIEWHSLQKELRAADSGLLHRRPQLRDHSAALDDFADTAALISEMDLVITIDTAVAHLAGAFGKPVWILLPYHADFRWLCDRDSSPWYPTARLFRQKSAGDWRELLGAMGTAIRTPGQWGPRCQ